MLVIKNQEELKRLKKIVNKDVYTSLELDFNTIIEEYPNRDEVNGPLLIVALEDEQDRLVKTYPLLGKLDTEDESVISENDNQRWERHLYLVNDSGYVIYYLYEKKMFRRNLYITRGINERVHPDLVRVLWMKLQEDTMRELDYLQVFRIEKVSTDKPVLKITWSQEQPEHEEEFVVNGVECDVDKIWVICTAPGTDEEYSTMLLPEEY